MTSNPSFLKEMSTEEPLKPRCSTALPASNNNKTSESQIHDGDFERNRWKAQEFCQQSHNLPQAVDRGTHDLSKPPS